MGYKQKKPARRPHVPWQPSSIVAPTCYTGPTKQSYHLFFGLNLSSLSDTTNNVSSIIECRSSRNAPSFPTPTPHHRVGHRDSRTTRKTTESSTCTDLLLLRSHIHPSVSTPRDKSGKELVTVAYPQEFLHTLLVVAVVVVANPLDVQSSHGTAPLDAAYCIRRDGDFGGGRQ